MIQFNSELCYTTEVPFQFARAHVHDASHHLVSFTIDLYSWSQIGVPISTLLAQRISKSEDYQRARELHVHIAPQHPKSCTNEKYSLNCISGAGGGARSGSAGREGGGLPRRLGATACRPAG